MDNLPVRSKRSQPQPKTPWDADQLAEKVWAMSGISKEKRADALAKAYDGAIEDLRADKTVVVSHAGVVTAELAQPDHAARAKARDQIFKLSGLEAAGAGRQGGDLVIPLPPWAQVKIEAKPEQAITVVLPPEASPA